MRQSVGWPARCAAAVLALLPVLSGCGSETEKTRAEAVESIPLYECRVINEFPHDRDAFTQGLLYDGGYLYEGTGQRGGSSLRRIDVETGEPQQVRMLADSLFGEGIALIGERIVQLTWTSRVGFVYDKQTFELLQQFAYLTQGWGLTYDGQRLLMSDGTSTLQILDPQTFEYRGFIRVEANGSPVVGLNELEYVEGEIFANVWPTERVARIDPGSGRVTGWIDCSRLLSPEDYQAPIDVLNGIAWDSAGHRLFVTGKLWPKLFEVELVAAGHDQ